MGNTDIEKKIFESWCRFILENIRLIKFYVCVLQNIDNEKCCKEMEVDK